MEKDTSGQERCGTSCAALKTLFAWTIVLCNADSEFEHKDVQIHFKQD